MGENETPIYKNEIRLNDASDIRKMLARVSNALIQGEISESRAKTLGYLSTQLLSCLKQGELEKRMAEIEKELNIQ